MDRLFVTEQRFTTIVKYKTWSSEAALKHWFSGCVDPDYERCKEVSTVDREVTFVYVGFNDEVEPRVNDEVETNAIKGWMWRKGLYSAHYEELLAFAAKYPDEHQKCTIVALGSGTIVDGHLLFATLSPKDQGGGLLLRRICDDRDCSADYWNSSYLFLAVVANEKIS